MDKITALLTEARIQADENRSKDVRHFAASVVEAMEELIQQLDDRASPGMVLSLKATIRDLQEQLSAADESLKSVERALDDVDYLGSYAYGVKYLKQQLASMTKERDEIAARARMLYRMVDERNGQLAAALAACEAKDEALAYYLPNRDTGAVSVAEEALAIQPDASILKAHDEALIERCAGLINKLEEAKRNPFSRDHNNGLQHAIDIIRELKERK